MKDATLRKHTENEAIVSHKRAAPWREDRTPPTVCDQSIHTGKQGSGTKISSRDTLGKPQLAL